MNKKDFIKKVEGLGYLKKFINPVVNECITKSISLNHMYRHIKYKEPNLLDLLKELKTIK